MFYIIYKEIRALILSHNVYKFSKNTWSSQIIKKSKYLKKIYIFLIALAKTIKVKEHLLFMNTKIYYNWKN